MSGPGTNVFSSTLRGYLRYPASGTLSSARLLPYPGDPPGPYIGSSLSSSFPIFFLHAALRSDFSPLRTHRCRMQAWWDPLQRQPGRASAGGDECHFMKIYPFHKFEISSRSLSSPLFLYLSRSLSSARNRRRAGIPFAVSSSLCRDSPLHACTTRNSAAVGLVTLNCRVRAR